MKIRYSVKDLASAEFLALIEADWVIAYGGVVLHMPEQAVVIDEDMCLVEEPKFVCGRSAKRARIPGIFERISTQRCLECCAKTGLRPGAGSPKNIFKEDK
jgi:hypothetical protein